MPSIMEIQKILENTKIAIDDYRPTAGSKEAAGPKIDRLKQLFAQGQQALVQVQGSNLSLNPEQVKNLLGTAKILEQTINTNRNSIERDAGIQSVVAYLATLQQLLQVLQNPAAKGSLKIKVSGVETEGRL